MVAVIPTRTGRGAAVPLRYSGGSGQSLCVAVCVRTHVRVHVSTAGLQLVENATYTYELLFYKAIEEHPDDVGSATEKSRHMVLKARLWTTPAAGAPGNPKVEEQAGLDDDRRNQLSRMGHRCLLLGPSCDPQGHTLLSPLGTGPDLFLVWRNGAGSFEYHPPREESVFTHLDVPCIRTRGTFPALY
ncbi:uncharacterized protein LOC117593619 isoform X1 [Esox lucius]|uniref:uncharacterized protein LOC117593619 isoform X1 n=1 Tax=Esox lucius TaxID=8010 RepID=UPI001476D5E0|nr:uncharacterized protein LOC117593619 isoform X1 [Esox lucius]